MVKRRSERQHCGRRWPRNRSRSHALLLLSCSAARSAVPRNLDLATCRQLEPCQLDLMHVMGCLEPTYTALLWLTQWQTTCLRKLPLRRG